MRQARNTASQARKQGCWAPAGRAGSSGRAGHSGRSGLSASACGTTGTRRDSLGSVGALGTAQGMGVRGLGVPVLRLGVLVGSVGPVRGFGAPGSVLTQFLNKF